MGFKARTYKLVFEDPTLEGLEVTTRGLSIGQLARLIVLLGKGNDLVAPEGEESRAELYATLAAGLVGWNLEDEDGVPVPLTVETLAAQEWSLVIEIAHGWMSAQAGVPRPLQEPSNGGPPSEVASLPMEVLSPSP